MNCPRCNGPASEQTLHEFGGVCPKCLLKFADEKDAPAFPNLEIVEMIGQGGMGVVYKAVQTNLGRTVALKVLSPQLSSDPEFVERFTREAKALAQLNHPNIVAIYDSGIHDRVPFLVMEYVKGQSLRQLLETKALTAARALELVPQICDALYYAHAKGVVHRDIKPENILLDGEGRVKIADYGLAKIASLDQPRITRTNVAMGTPHYMAPEQIEKTSAVDHRADIYSLGVVIYEMLTGELPLGRFKPPSERATIDRRLDRVVLKSLEKEPDDRYQSADEVKSQIAHLDQAPQTPASTGPRLSKMAVASGILCLSGITSLILATILMSVDKPTGAGIFGSLGGGLLFISAVFSLISFILILSSHGTLRGLWIPVSSGLFCGLMLPAGFLLFTRSSTASSTPSVAVSKPTSFRLNSAWPVSGDLPEGLKFETVTEGLAILPDPDSSLDDVTVTAVRGPALKAVQADLKILRRAYLANGTLALVGFEFKTEEARQRWRRELGLRPVRCIDGREPEGRSFFQISGTRKLPPSAELTASLDLLTSILKHKMMVADGLDQLRIR